MMNSALGKWGAAQLGIPTERPLPTFAPKPFSMPSSQPSKPDAVLVIDTFSQWNHPEVAHAALELAERLGLHIKALRLPGEACCGRPAISKGLLDKAKGMARRNAQTLADLPKNAAALP